MSCQNSSGVNHGRTSTFFNLNIERRVRVPVLLRGSPAQPCSTARRPLRCLSQLPLVCEEISAGRETGLPPPPSWLRPEPRLLLRFTDSNKRSVRTEAKIHVIFLAHGEEWGFKMQTGIWFNLLNKKCKIKNKRHRPQCTAADRKYSNSCRRQVAGKSWTRQS